MNLKNMFMGLVGAASLLGASQALAWEPTSVQRGWVDSIGNIPYPDFVVGPTIPMSIRGWACVRPGLYDYGVPPTYLTVFYAGVPQPLLEHKEREFRYDLVAANACAGSYQGFLVWIAKPTNSVANYAVYFQGPYEATRLGGQTDY